MEKNKQRRGLESRCGILQARLISGTKKGPVFGALWKVHR
jgi:hypothetical protein